MDTLQTLNSETKFINALFLGLYENFDPVTMIVGCAVQQHHIPRNGFGCHKRCHDNNTLCKMIYRRYACIAFIEPYCYATPTPHTCTLTPYHATPTPSPTP